MTKVFSVTTEFSDHVSRQWALCHDRFGLDRVFLGRDKDFLVTKKPLSSMSRHDFPCVAT